MSAGNNMPWPGASTPNPGTPNNRPGTTVKRDKNGAVALGAVTTTTLTVGGVAQNVSHAADANGWTLDYLLSGKRIWRKIITGTALTAAVAQANTFTLPVGVATCGVVTWDNPAPRGGSGVNAEVFHPVITSADTTTTLNVGLRAIIAGNLNSFGNTTIDYVVTLVER